MHQATDDNEMDHQFIVTYHPNKQQLPQRTIQLIFHGPKTTDDVVIQTFLESVKDFLSNLKKKHETPPKQIENKMEPEKKKETPKKPTITYKPKKSKIDSDDTHPLNRSYNNIYEDFYGN